MRPRVDAARIAEQLAGERVRGDALPDARRARGRGTRGPGRRRAPPRAGASPRAARERQRRWPWISSASSAIGTRRRRRRRTVVDRAPRARGRPPRRAPRARRRRARSGRRCRRRARRRSRARSRRAPSGRACRPPTTVRFSSSTRVDAETAAAALVGDRRVDVAVADDGRAALERGPDHLVDVLRAGGGVERDLRPGRDVLAVEDEVADRLAERRAARLAREDDVHALALERLREEPRLGRLARAVDALEGDEHRRDVRPIRSSRLPRCARSSPAGPASSARTSSTRSSRAATRSSCSTTSSTGRREHVDAAATFVEHDIRRAVRRPTPSVVFHLAAQADVGTSMERPSFDAEVNVVGTRERARGRARRRARRSSSPRPAARSTATSTSPPREDSALLPVSAVRPREARRPRSTSTAGTGSTAQAHVVAALRERLRAAPVGGARGRRRRDLPRAARGGRADDDLRRRRRARATSSTSTTSCARSSLAGDRRGGVFNVGTGIETSVAELHELCEQAVGVDAPPRYGPPRAGDARRSVLDPSRAAARARASRAEVALGSGHRRDPRARPRRSSRATGEPVLRGSPAPTRARRARRPSVAHRDRSSSALSPPSSSSLLLVVGGALLAKSEPAAPAARAQTTKARRLDARRRRHAGEAAPARRPRRPTSRAAR